MTGANELIYYTNGEFIGASKALMPITHRSYTVFDTERTFHGQIFRLEDHIERLGRSLKYVRIEPELTLEEICKVSMEVARLNEPLRKHYGDYWITQLVSNNRLSVIAEPLPFSRHAKFYSVGSHLITTSIRRTSPEAVDPKVKTVDRLNLVLADIEAKQVDEEGYPLLVDDQGNLTEIVSGNLFVVSNGVIRTPGPRSILLGVSRQTTMELAHALNIPVMEAELQHYDLYTADEAFVTTTSFCILPVGRFNGTKVGAESPGSITQRLTSAWSELVGLDIVEQAQRYGIK